MDSSFNIHRNKQQGYQRIPGSSIAPDRLLRYLREEFNQQFELESRKNYYVIRAPRDLSPVCNPCKKKQAKRLPLTENTG
ncbi:hypothetical protein CORC01_08721 [Colletotrichum orchidophilum]|uniref:Uncharacterized protein n=1 Tax=Colletotrichum orchidophilum TaxID=1209926 RepID=A0A1G4B3N0_9PEZI|nr:uncharacterized protein CORC01_08721 [Colletotrichum orchidophilum]OHE96028.1 hypothetical protein CORC01_08721 [Colletotrichum orchidophilum]